MYVNNLSEITSAYIGAKQTVQNANTPNSSSSPNSSEDKENGVSLTISSEAITQYNDYLTSQLQQQLESNKAQEDAFEDTAKLMEIARRISNGDHVPAADEKKLMEFNFKLYQIAKSAAIMSENNKPKEYDSLFEEDNEDEDIQDKVNALYSEATTPQDSEAPVSETENETIT